MLDGEKETGQDVLPKEGQPSAGEKSTPSKAQTKSYTESELNKMISERHSKLDKTIASLSSERDTLKQSLQSTTSRLDALEREIDDSRLAEVRDDPAQLRAYQRVQALTKREREAEARESELAKREAQLKEERQQLDKDKGVVSIAYIAAKHGLNTEELESLGISDSETLEKVAEKLAVRKSKAEGGEEFTPDSGVTTGGEELTEEQRLKARYPTMK